MRTPILILTGLATLGLAGIPALAAGTNARTHEMTVQLPDGSVAQINYTGNVAPKVVIGSPMADAAWMSPVSFWNDPAFARMERISWDMDRQMDAMLHQAQAMFMQPFAANPGLFNATLNDLPAGSKAYSWSISSNGGNFCEQSVQITSVNGGKPHVVSHTSGNCGNGNAAAGQNELQSPASASRAIPVSVKMPVMADRRSTL